MIIFGLAKIKPEEKLQEGWLVGMGWLCLFLFSLKIGVSQPIILGNFAHA